MLERPSERISSLYFFMKAAWIMRCFAASFALKRQIEKLLHHVTHAHTSRSLFDRRLRSHTSQLVEATLLYTLYSTNYKDNHLFCKKSRLLHLLTLSYQSPKKYQTQFLSHSRSREDNNKKILWVVNAEEICFLNLPFWWRMQCHALKSRGSSITYV